MDDQLTKQERGVLLRLARQAMEDAVNDRPLGRLDLKSLPPSLRQPGATFVTLTIQGGLRGCVGALEPHLPLAEDVREHAVAAALQDYRFPPVRPDELAEIEIEVSRLTIPQPIEYNGHEDLLQKLRPGVDGVILVDGIHRATFLPRFGTRFQTQLSFSTICVIKWARPQTFGAKNHSRYSFTR
jgi:hypothetical protein